jgi:hypothetical protein
MGKHGVIVDWKVNPKQIKVGGMIPVIKLDDGTTYYGELGWKEEGEETNCCPL